MTIMNQKTGSCLCGAVSFEGSFAPELQACHCVQCQRWTGGGPLIVARSDDLRITGADQIAHYRASSWGERGFCKACGSPLYWRMQDGPVTQIAAGLLDDQSDLHMSEEIFVDHRPAWLPPWPEAGQSTEAQEFEKLRAFQDQEGKST